ncbi:tetratricopeptide repeat protein [Bradyrhizobium sp. dw_411]|uniref:tetratricopeptide repeat protein n=1 Tax=Bradyrhizobium sp. dw_411 TaxID=2720082 RepID=UPI001BCCAC95|nr:tetratricopeptide repeat protein [Bradyrhizobium sp. dw_411]
MTADARISNKAVRKGMAHLEAGRIDSAERLFRGVLLSEPRNAEANHALGALAVRQGKPQSALSFLTAALQADPQQGQHWLSFAEALLLTGAVGDARAVLDRAIARGFSSPALKIRIDHAELHHHARDHHKAGRFTEAEKLYTAILSADPGHADSLHMFGQLAHQTSRAEAAIRLISEAIRLKGDVAEFHCSLGIVLAESGRLEEAKQCFERALALQPGSPEAQTGLGYVYRSLGQVDEAIRRYSAVIAAGVNTADAHNNLGALLFDLNRLDEAAVHGMEALRQNPDLAEAHNNLGNVYRETGRLDEALRHYREALRLKPGYAPAWNNIGNALKSQGKLTEAIANFRTAISLDPGFFPAHSNLIMTLGYSAEVPHEMLVEQARQFNDAVAVPLLRTRAFANVPDPGRRLRIGYVSGDFRNHVVNYFFEPLLAHHAKDDFEFFAYANMHAEDDVTGRLKQHFDHWRDIRALSDDAAADLIEADGIDILIDMSGHMAGNRMLLFARKPAPVQATWLGFTTTTGVKAIDYRITDIYADPPGMTEHLNTETLWRLPATFCCYQARAGIADPIDHPPRDDNGFTTFGCFNNFTKVTDGTLECWAEILQRVGDARLLLEIPGIDGAEFRAETQARLARLGLPLDRVILEPRKRSNQYVLYNKIDIALDPFPFNGGATTLDATWMGVPVVSLAGKYFTARMGVTIMNNIGLPELSAADEKTYVDIAANLATDPSRLRAIRHNLRQRMSGSPIMDYAAFARDIESAYRGMWQAWCTKQSEKA